MKKILTLIMAALTAFSLTACSSLDSIIPSDSAGSTPMSDYADSADSSEPDSLPDDKPTQTEEVSADESAVQTDEASASKSKAQSAPDNSDGFAATTEESAEQPNAPPEDGFYSSRDEVALYIHVYGRLPDNFITKKEARELGWSGGSVEEYTAPGMCIGGDRFGNYEGLLPEKEGRTYTECDIDTVGKSSRGAKRIIFSNDGLIYYTDDHYASFTLLYGEE